MRELSLFSLVAMAVYCELEVNRVLAEKEIKRRGYDIAELVEKYLR